MKRGLFILTWGIAAVLVWSCQQNLKIGGASDTNVLSKIDSIIPDSMVSIRNDSIPNDSFVVESLLKEPYEQLFFEDKPYAVNVLVYEFKLDTSEIVLIDNQYQSLNYAYKEDPKDYLMLTNGGMFHPRGIPVGLFVDETVELTELNLNQDHGNFFLLPNGVFFVSCDNVAGVLETEQFRDSIYNKETSLKLATQSGPMLVIDSVHHPKFNQNSPNTYIRSGVGVTEDQRIIFILSQEVVNLYTFASVFLAKGCKNALYLDGAISDMYIKNMEKDISSFTTRYGPVIGVLSKKDTTMVRTKEVLHDSTVREKQMLYDSIIPKKEMLHDSIPSSNSINTKDEN